MSSKISKKNSKHFSSFNNIDAQKLIEKKEHENSALKKILDFLDKEKISRQKGTDPTL